MQLTFEFNLIQRLTGPDFSEQLNKSKIQALFDAN